MKGGAGSSRFPNIAMFFLVEAKHSESYAGRGTRDFSSELPTGVSGSLSGVAQGCARSFDFFYQTPFPLDSRNGGAHLGSSSLT